jgi:cation diffusion facilitator CzcD-associated flavoprotein CzcO
VSIAPTQQSGPPEHFDVLVVGAGLSGIGAGYRLQSECPQKTYAILEGRAASGGTWDLFRYPGIRSDSDMFTLGYPFRPWRDPKAIADGTSILHYIRDTAREFGVDRHIRYRHHVRAASWDSTTARWTLDIQVGDQTDPVQMTCRFLYACSGYYSYEGGYMPEFPGLETFTGEVIHPQKWPEDLDYNGKRVVIIGSGATAVTLVPALADRSAHVTMLQRSPSYIASLPAVDPLAQTFRRWLPEKFAHRAARWKSVVLTQAFYQFCRRAPRAARKVLLATIAAQLPAGYETDPTFSPRYDPWDQRMCLVPDGDLFKAIRAGRASIVTDQIEGFTPTGIALRSGKELDADIIVSATGLQLVACGGIHVSVDGSTVEPGSTYVYRGCMLSDIPNFAMCVGYTNASWTLRADLTSRYVCRMLNHMDRKGHIRTVPRYSGSADISRPLLDLHSGYITRAAGLLPKQGDRPPWRLRQNYLLDYLTARFAGITDSVEFFDSPAGLGRPGPAARPDPALASVGAQMRTSESSPPNSFDT